MPETRCAGIRGPMPPFLSLQHPGRADVPGIIVAAWVELMLADMDAPRRRVQWVTRSQHYPWRIQLWFLAMAETGTQSNSMIYPVMPYGIAAGCICIGEATKAACQLLRPRCSAADRPVACTDLNKNSHSIGPDSPFQYHPKINDRYCCEQWNTGVAWNAGQGQDDYCMSDL